MVSVLKFPSMCSLDALCIQWFNVQLPSLDVAMWLAQLPTSRHRHHSHHCHQRRRTLHTPSVVGGRAHFLTFPASKREKHSACSKSYSAPIACYTFIDIVLQGAGWTKKHVLGKIVKSSDTKILSTFCVSLYISISSYLSMSNPPETVLRSCATAPASHWTLHTVQCTVH